MSTQPTHREKQLEGKIEYLTQKLKEKQGVKSKPAVANDQQILKEMADKLKAQKNYIKALEDATKTSQANQLLASEKQLFEHH